jgi:hypothetical protein
MGKRTDDMILKKIGLTDKELSSMQADFSNFAKALNKAELESLKKSLLSAKAAAKSLNIPEVTPEYLEAFIRGHAPKDTAATVVIVNSAGP